MEKTEEGVTTPKKIGFTLRKVNTYKKLVTKSNGEIPLAAIVRDIVEKVAKGELKYENGRGYFD